MGVARDSDDGEMTHGANPVVDGWNDVPDDGQPRHAPLEFHVHAPPAEQPIEPRPAQAAPAVALLLASIPNRVWVPLLVLTAILLCVSAAYDILTILTPGSFANPRWRFAIIGSAVPKMVKVAGAAAVFTLALVYREQRVLSNVFAALLAIASVAILLVAPLFLLDAMQVRLILPPRMSGNVFVANVSSVTVLLILMSLVLLACAFILRKSASWLKLDLNAPDKVANREWDR